jgi:iron(III) transport system substrate-binding protein
MLRFFSLFAIVLCFGCSRSPDRVVLYCAQDREYAEEILNEFRDARNASLATKFDTEATKSVSLYEEIVREANRPRCSLFWNNEPLNTIRLQRRGLLDGTWQPFAARARVLIVNTNLVAEADRPKGLMDLVDPRWKGKLVMAKPQFGTTATQAACLFDVLGPDAAKTFYRGLHANGIAIAAGNKPVARAVSRGEYAVGLTDSDDAIGEIDTGHPVALILPDRDGLPGYPTFGTLLIPNTLAAIKNGPKPAKARELMEYLRSPEIEARLAAGGGFQIPLLPETRATLHPALAEVHSAKAMQVDWDRAVDHWDDVQAFLRDLFAR